MSLPFTKGKPQREDELAVSTEIQGKECVKRWRGIEFGFKVRVTKVTRRVKAQPQQGLSIAAKAALDAPVDPGPDPGDQEESEATYAVVVCLTPPTDPPRG